MWPQFLVAQSSSKSLVVGLSERLSVCPSVDFVRKRDWTFLPTYLPAYTSDISDSIDSSDGRESSEQKNSSKNIFPPFFFFFSNNFFHTKKK